MKAKVLRDIKTDKKYVIEADHREKTIGRAPDCKIPLIEPTVSGYHAVIIHEKDGTVYVQDTKSTNGTYIIRQNREEIDVKEFTRQYKRRHPVYLGETIRFGSSDKSPCLVLEPINMEEQKREDRKRLEDTVIES